MKKKIIAFAGSNSSKSINKKPVKHALSRFDGYEITLLDLNDFETAIFSVDREEKNGYPEQAYRFHKYMEDADIIICSLAENNRTYSAAFKNIFDWCSRIDLNIFKNKPMLLMSTSPGGYGGGNVMNAAKSYFPECGANIIETFSLPRFQKNFDDVQGITDPELKAEFENKITAFKSALNTISET
jgi:NAD(P)H-dependent FMN reductase